MTKIEEMAIQIVCAELTHGQRRCWLEDTEDSTLEAITSVAVDVAKKICAKAEGVEKPVCEHKFVSLLKKQTPPSIQDINKLNHSSAIGDNCDIGGDCNINDNLSQTIEALTAREYIITCEKCGAMLHE
jgi:hypothetical protein